MGRFGGAFVLGAISAAGVVAWLLREQLWDLLLPLRRVGRDLPLRRVGRNLLRNGSFEDGTGRAGEYLTPLSNGAPNITEWQVLTSGSAQKIGWSREENTGVIQAKEGTHFIELSADGGAQGPYGGVAQTVSLIPGASYELVVWVGASNGSEKEPDRRSGPQVDVTTAVELNGLPRLSFTDTVQRPAKSYDWREFTHPFVASGTVGPGGGIQTRILIDAPIQTGPGPGKPSRVIAVDHVQLYRLSPFLRWA